MGAHVTKVEPPGTGELMRSMGASDTPLMSHGFVGQNANKHSIALDLKHPDAAPVVEQLIRNSDVLVHNMRPGVPDRLGIGVAAARELNPKLIYCAISGYGQHGPASERPALDHLMQGESGMFDATGPVDGPAMRVGFAVADSSTAVIASSAICAALYRRSQTHQGVFLDVSMLECCLTVMGLNSYTYLGSGYCMPRVGPNPLAQVGSVGTFPTKTDSLLVNANNHRLFERLAEAVGYPGLVERYPAGPVFREEWESLRLEFAAIFETRSADEWEAVLTAAGVPVGQVRHLSRVFENPQLAYRKAVTKIGSQRYINAGFQVDGEATSPSRPADALGDSSIQVLRELGLSDSEVDALLSSGAVVAGDSSPKS